MPWDAHTHRSARSGSQPVMIRGRNLTGWLGFCSFLHASLWLNRPSCDMGGEVTICSSYRDFSLVSSYKTVVPRTERATFCTVMLQTPTNKSRRSQRRFSRELVLTTRQNTSEEHRFTNQVFRHSDYKH